MSPRAALWDLDGTLVDSGDYHWRAWRDTMAAEGRPLAYQEFLDSFGQKNDSILAAWLGSSVAAHTVQRVGDAKEALYRELAQREGLAPLPGAVEWVTRLHGEGWLQAIASSAPRANVEVMLGAVGMAQYIDAIVAAEDVSAGKPDPQVFLAAAATLRVPPARCIVVEDAAAGIEAARRAGMRSIGVSAAAVLRADVFTRSLASLPQDTFDRLLDGP